MQLELMMKQSMQTLRVLSMNNNNGGGLVGSSTKWKAGECAVTSQCQVEMLVPNGS
jgi:hypothetical protein